MQTFIILNYWYCDDCVLCFNFQSQKSLLQLVFLDADGKRYDMRSPPPRTTVPGSEHFVELPAFEISWGAFGILIYSAKHSTSTVSLVLCETVVSLRTSRPSKCNSISFSVAQINGQEINSSNPQILLSRDYTLFNFL